MTELIQESTLAERLAVVKIADGAAAGVEHRFVDIGHGADQEGDAAPDPAVRAARDDGAPLPRGLLHCRAECATL